jgi:hypothetical protein
MPARYTMHGISAIAGRDGKVSGGLHQNDT